MNNAVDNTAKVAVAWGPDAPDWVLALARAADATSQMKAAAQIGSSGPLVNQVLSNRYKGDLAGVEERVKAAFMAEEILCPGVGDTIPLASCLDHQAHAKAKNRSSAFRAQMTLACAQCPHSRIG